MRLDKYLSDLGIGTRSEVKTYIKKGRVKLDDQIVKDPGTNVSNMTVKFDDQVLEPLAEHYYLLMNKPAGYVCSKDEPGKKLIYSLIHEAKYHKVNTVGRLDEDTEGLILLTDDGKLNHHLMSPKHHIPKKYFVQLKNPCEADYVSKFANGIDIGDETLCLPAVLEQTPETDCVYVTLKEGRYHQVKRMFEALQNEVVYLNRVSLGNILLKDLKLGEYRELTKEELEILWKKEES